MKMPNQSFNGAKKIITSNIGRNVDFVSKVSRGKVIKSEGIILNAYKNIFTISMKEKNKESILSFSYCDLINNSVKLKIK